jgi:hypothetical protein
MNSTTSGGPEVFTQSKVLIVSPHLDDAVLSCASLLAWPGVEVLTVFAGRPGIPLAVPHDLKLGFADSDEAMETRIAEDQRALEGYGVPTRRLAYLDATYAGYPRPPETGEGLRSALDEWLGGLAPLDRPLVLLPAGTGHMKGAWLVRPQPPETSAAIAAVTPRSRAGKARRIAIALGARWIAHRIFLLKKRARSRTRSFGHHDHLYVRDELLEHLLANSRATVALYEELPYKWLREGQLAVDELAERLGLNAERCDIAVDTSAKASRIALYSSQVALLAVDGRRVDDPLLLEPFERFWIVDSPRAGKDPQTSLPAAVEEDDAP